MTYIIVKINSTTTTLKTGTKICITIVLSMSNGWCSLDYSEVLRPTYSIYNIMS